LWGHFADTVCSGGAIGSGLHRRAKGKLGEGQDRSTRQEQHKPSGFAHFALPLRENGFAGVTPAGPFDMTTSATDRNYATIFG
jgi:hypothetical protein